MTKKKFGHNASLIADAVGRYRVVTGKGQTAGVYRSGNPKTVVSHTTVDRALKAAGGELRKAIAEVKKEADRIAAEM